jgi:hypothetical protein
MESNVRLGDEWLSTSIVVEMRCGGSGSVSVWSGCLRDGVMMSSYKIHPYSVIEEDEGIGFVECGYVTPGFEFWTSTVFADHLWKSSQTVTSPCLCEIVDVSVKRSLNLSNTFGWHTDEQGI